MLYHWGKNCKQELIIFSGKSATLGTFLNTSTRPNCRAIRSVISGSIVILIYSLQIIKANEELTYDYNGSSNDYPTFDLEEV